MIVATISDPHLLASVRRAARRDEDVVAGHGSSEALRLGFPRAVVRHGTRAADANHGAAGATLPTLTLQDALLGAWEDERRAGGPRVPAERKEYVAFRIRAWLGAAANGQTWVDLVLRDLGRTAGRPLPLPFRGMARRVLELPSAYSDLESLAVVGRLSVGALKARFRRRGLPSPHTYLRWLRSLAVGHVLAEAPVTTLAAAHRVGITSSGNLSRAVKDTTGFKPTDLRRPGARARLLVAMVERLLSREALLAWDDLDELFLEVA